MVTRPLVKPAKKKKEAKVEQRSRLERNEGEMRKEVWRQSEGCRSWSRSSWAPRLLQLWLSYRLELWCPSASIREGLVSSPSSVDATNATDDRLSVSLNRRRSPSSVRVLSDQRITLSGLKFKDSLETFAYSLFFKGTKLIPLVSVVLSLQSG